MEERGPSRKTSIRLYPEDSFDLFEALATIMEKMILVPYDKYQRMLETQSIKTPTAPKPTKKNQLP